MPPAVSGLMMNICAGGRVAFGILAWHMRDTIGDLGKRIGEPDRIAADLCAELVPASYSRERLTAIWMIIAAIGASTAIRMV